MKKKLIMVILALLVPINAWCGSDQESATARTFRAKPITPADYDTSLKGTQWKRGGEGYFWYQDPVKPKKKKKVVHAHQKPKVQPHKKKAPKPKVYVRPEFKDLPILPNLPVPLQQLMGNPTVENAKKWLEYQARLIGRARLVGEAIHKASLKYGDEIYPDASMHNSMGSTMEKVMLERRKRYANRVLAENGVLLAFLGDYRTCMDCLGMGDYLNMLVQRGITVVAVHKPGEPPHPRATYPYVIDNADKLAKRFDVHGTRPVFVAVFPKANKHYTVGRNLMSPDDLVMTALEFAEDDKIVPRFEYNPRNTMLRAFLNKLGGTDGKTDTVGGITAKALGVNPEAAAIIAETGGRK